MIYTPKERSKEISLRIKTVVIDEENSIEKEFERLVEQAVSGKIMSDDELDGFLDDGDVDEIELLTEARIRTNKEGLVEIVYRENEDDEQLHTISRIIFDPNFPELVIMTKKGAINSSLSFEEDKMHICSYVTPYMPFKVYVSSSRVENRLLEKGRLLLDYTLNINDTPPQHFIVNAEIKDVADDPLKDLF